MRRPISSVVFGRALSAVGQSCGLRIGEARKRNHELGELHESKRIGFVQFVGFVVEHASADFSSPRRNGDSTPESALQTPDR